MGKDAHQNEDQRFSQEELHAAIDTLQRLLPEREVSQLQPSSPNAIYTTYLTLWMLILQRLGGGKSLEGVVKDVLANNRELLPPNKRVLEGTLSQSSAAYSNARQRLKLQTVEHLAERVSQSLIEAASPVLDDRLTFIIDGTTITLPPTPELQEAFPPATNQHGETVWPVAMLLVAHELRSGVALPPEIGAMYGEDNTSEAAQAKAIAERLPAGAVLMADAGFGIFGVVYHVVSTGRPILFRMTKSRFKPLSRHATLLEDIDGHRTYQVRWTPSAKDRRTHEELPEDAAVDVFLHQVTLASGETLYLVTTLPLTSAEAGEHYARRYDVEHDIRDIKVALDTENIRVQTVGMVKKELLTSIVAYNLVVQFRRQAAALAGVLPRRLSFTRVWDNFSSYLLSYGPCDSAAWTRRFEEALAITARYAKLPSRPGRSYPRRAHPRRPKSTKFMKQQRQQDTRPPPTESQS